jgi:ATP/maltotriose-dependent transcriptional regulator MalT
LNLDAAEEYFTKARAVVRQDYPDEIFVIDYHLAELEYARGKHAAENGAPQDSVQRYFDNARDMFRHVLEHAENRQHKRAITHTLYYLGKISRRHGDYAVAASLFDRGQQIAEKYDDQIILARYCLGRAKLDQARGDGASALQLAKLARARFERQLMTIEFEEAEVFIKELSKSSR